MLRASKLTRVLALGLAGGALFLAGVEAGKDGGSPFAAPRLSPAMRLITAALGRLEHDYFRALSPAPLTDAALQAGLSTLHDPYTHYYDRPGWRRFTSSLARLRRPST